MTIDTVTDAYIELHNDHPVAAAVATAVVAVVVYKKLTRTARRVAMKHTPFK